MRDGGTYTELHSGDEDPYFEFVLGCWDAGLWQGHFDYPFPIADLWEWFEEIDQANREVIGYLNLPETSDPSESVELMGHLAEFFEVRVTDLVEAIGGGWYSVDKTDLILTHEWKLLLRYLRVRVRYRRTGILFLDGSECVCVIQRRTDALVFCALTRY